MFIGLFRFVDDWLIDTIFQPICDWLREVLDWSKRVPIAITEAGIGHTLWLISIVFPMAYNLFFVWVGALAFTASFFYLIACLVRLMMESFLGPPNQDQSFDRRKQQAVRYGVWKFCAFMLLGIHLSYPQFTYLTAQLALLLLVRAYFVACSNHPKRKKPEPVTSPS